MSLQGTFNTAVQGMNTDAHAMSVISSNIANVATTGYKTQNTHFETILNHVRPNEQKFLSVKAVDWRNVSAQGQIGTTNRTLDLALNGRGFMVTNTEADGSGIWQFTRDGGMFGKATNIGTTQDPVPGVQLMTSGGATLFGWPVNSDGTFTETGSLSSLKPVSYSMDAVLPAKPTENINLAANVSGEVDGRQTVTVPYIDLNGSSRTITIGFTPVPGALGTDGTLTSTYDLDFTASTGENVTSNDVRTPFGTQAQLIVPTSGALQLNVGDPLGTVQPINLNLSQMTDFKDQGQITVQNVDDDGYLASRLNNAYFNSEGVLIGSYANGEVKNLFKLPVATFAVEDKLSAMPGNYFVQTEEAGQMQIRGLGSQSTSTGGTAFVAGALERSTVDLADQFSRMIVTQRAYSSNAQVVRAADEMTQAVRDLKR